MRHKLIGFHALQVKALTPRQYRNRQFANFRGRKNEFHMGGGFFKRLQKRVERVFGQHVHFIDNIYLEARGYGCIANTFDNLADIINTGPARGIHFKHINMTRFGN